MQLQHYLITGGTGFIGSALVRRLFKLGHRVRLLDNGLRSSTERIRDILDDVEVLHGDIRNPQVVFEAIRGVDGVFHLAALNGTNAFYQNPGLVLDIGVRGILNVIEGCQREGVRELFVASSSEVYQTPACIPTDENTPLEIPDVLNPRYSYGGSKIISELLALHQGSSGFKRVIIFRPHNVYGPDMGMGHVIPQFIERAIRQINLYPTGSVLFNIQGDGTQTRSFTYIDDMIDGLMLLLEKGEHLNIYHIGNPEEVTIASVAEKIFENLGRGFELETTDVPFGSTLRRCPDVSKMQALGFSPQVMLSEGLPSVIEWYKTYEEV